MRLNCKLLNQYHVSSVNNSFIISHKLSIECCEYAAHLIGFDVRTWAISQ